MTKTKPTTEIIVTQDKYSKDVENSLLEYFNQVNAFLDNFEKMYHISFSDEDLKLLHNCTMTQALKIASKFYNEFTPHFAKIQQQELAEQLINRPQGEKSLQNILNTMGNCIHYSLRATRPEIIYSDFADVKDGRFRLSADAGKRLNAIFTEKISGLNLEAYNKALEIVKQVDELQEMFGRTFNNMFDSTLDGKSIVVDERVFIDEKYF